MIKDELSPDLDLISQEFVLIQAWKKTASYIRYHNWYSDTLELDRTAANLPRFLDELGQAAKQVDAWENTPLRMVPAPKSQSWRIFDGQWRPAKGNKTESKLRPLAHADLKSQVLATAIMMCVADRVESRPTNGVRFTYNRLNRRERRISGLAVRRVLARKDVEALLAAEAFFTTRARIVSRPLRQ